MNTIHFESERKLKILNDLETGTYFKLRENDNIYILTDETHSVPGSINSSIICVNPVTGITVHLNGDEIVEEIFDADIILK